MLGLTLLLSCQAQKSKSQVLEANEHQRDVQIVAEDTYKQSNIAEFQVKNITEGEELYVYTPKDLVIEKSINGNWEKLRVLYCPCGASCPPPPEWKKLVPNQSLTISWDLHEEWCEASDPTVRVPETHSRYAGKGLYRIVILFARKRGGEIQSKYKTFHLK